MMISWQMSELLLDLQTYQPFKSESITHYFNYIPRRGSRKSGYSWDEGKGKGKDLSPKYKHAANLIWAVKQPRPPIPGLIPLTHFRSTSAAIYIINRTCYAVPLNWYKSESTKWRGICHANKQVSQLNLNTSCFLISRHFNMMMLVMAMSRKKKPSKSK